MVREPRDLSHLSPIWGYARFTPDTSNPGFILKTQLGLQKISDHFKDNTIMPFEYLK